MTTDTEGESGSGVEDTLKTGAGLDLFASVSDRRQDPMPGRLLGDYRILELISAGGMGQVYRGERADGSFEREVAIKVSPMSGLSPTLRESFIREQRTLASLSHPNITRLYDARLSDDGLPYIVMELVDGAGIDEYCRERSLGTEAIVKLLVSICDAIAYAHSALVVHRDIKPSNVLVDTTGQPRLLDFGIAKLLGDEEGALTRAAPLTPRYASPEQLLGEQITTASDVYQLGLLACELLTGESPLGDIPAADAIQRAADRKPVILSPAARAALPREVTLIIEQCLRVSPLERYRSVSLLKDDFTAYLNGYPVGAAGQSAGYRFRKFVSRNRVAVSIAAAAVITLVGGGAWYTVQLDGARRAAEQEATNATEIADFLTGMLAASIPETQSPETLTVRTLLDQGAEKIRTDLDDQPEVRVRLLMTMADAYSALAQLDQAAALVQEAIDIQQTLDPDALAMADALNRRAFIELEHSRYNVALATLDRALAIADRHESTRAVSARGEISHTYGSVYLESGQSERAIDYYRKSYELVLEAGGIRHPFALQALTNLAVAKFEARDYEGAIEEAQGVLQLAEELHGDLHASMPAANEHLSRAYQQLGRFEEARDAGLRAVALATALYGADHPSVAWPLAATATAFGGLGLWDEGIANMQRSLEIMTATYGEEHDYTTDARSLLAFFYIKAARYDEAKEQLRLCEIAMTQRLPPVSHPFADLWFNWGGLYKLTGEYEPALEYFGKTLEIYTELYGPDDRWTADALLEIAEVQRLMGNHEAAADRYEQGLAILLPLFGENHPATLKYSRGQLVSLEALDRTDEAAVVEARITRSDATEVAEE